VESDNPAGEMLARSWSGVTETVGRLLVQARQANQSDGDDRNSRGENRDDRADDDQKVKHLHSISLLFRQGQRGTPRSFSLGSLS
jgi:hypothetical protein